MPTLIINQLHSFQHAKFRVVMLIVFVLGCFLFYTALHVTMNLPGGEVSCFQPTEEITAEEVEP